MWSSPLCRVGRPCLTGLNQICVCRSAEGGTRSALLPWTKSGFCSCGASGDTCKDDSFALCKQGIRKWVREPSLKAPSGKRQTRYGTEGALGADCQPKFGFSACPDSNPVAPVRSEQSQITRNSTLAKWIRTTFTWRRDRCLSVRTAPNAPVSFHCP